MESSALILKCFVAGVTGVFLVMAILLVAVTLSSKLAIWIESKTVDKNAASQAGKG